MLTDFSDISHHFVVFLSGKFFDFMAITFALARVYVLIYAHEIRRDAAIRPVREHSLPQGVPRASAPLFCTTLKKHGSRRAFEFSEAL